MHACMHVDCDLPGQRERDDSRNDAVMGEHVGRGELPFVNAISSRRLQPASVGVEPQQIRGV